VTKGFEHVLSNIMNSKFLRQEKKKIARKAVSGTDNKKALSRLRKSSGVASGEVAPRQEGVAP
jgi:hypothetical protein